MMPLCSSNSLQMVLTTTIYIMCVFSTGSTNKCGLQMTEKMKDTSTTLRNIDIKFCQFYCKDSFIFASCRKSKNNETGGFRDRPQNHPHVLTKQSASKVCNLTSSCLESGSGKAIGVQAEEKGYTTFHVEGGEIHLKRYNVGRTWDGALEMCRSDGATLVKIDTAEKQDIVRGLFNFNYEKTKQPWIGLRDTTRSNVYRWTDGSVPTYTNWNKGEPAFTYEGQDEDCVLILLQMFGSVWNDRDCNMLRWFVCEM